MISFFYSGWKIYASHHFWWSIWAHGECSTVYFYINFISPVIMRGTCWWWRVKNGVFCNPINFSHERYTKEGLPNAANASEWNYGAKLKCPEGWGFSMRRSAPLSLTPIIIRGWSILLIEETGYIEFHEEVNLLEGME